MMAAQPSVGAAATPPTTGTIRSAADPTRQGAATSPQPERPRQASISKALRIHFASAPNPSQPAMAYQGRRMKFAAPEAREISARMSGLL